jgi:uncharacterized protein YbgA (DUF1722 family)
MKPNAFLLLILFCCFSPGYLSAQMEWENQISAKITRFTATFTQDKVKILPEQTEYELGDILRYKIALVDAQTYQRNHSDIILFVELLDPDGRVRDGRNLIARKGLAVVETFLEPTWPNGAYILRVRSDLPRHERPLLAQQQVFHVWPEGLKKNILQGNSPLR